MQDVDEVYPRGLPVEFVLQGVPSKQHQAGGFSTARPVPSPLLAFQEHNTCF